MLGGRRARLGVAASLIVVAGCSVSPPVEAPSAAAPSTPAASLTVNAEPTPSVPPTLPSPSPLSSQQKYVESASHGVKFAVPKSWSMMDLSTFADPDVRKALEPIAKKLGLTVDEYVTQLTEDTDLIATGKETDGYSPSVSVRKEEAKTLGDVPTQEDAKADVDAIGGTVTSVKPELTPLGPGYSIVYSHPGEDASTTRYGATMVLPSSHDTVFLLTLDAATASDRDALVTGIVTTLRAS